MGLLQHENCPRYCNIRHRTNYRIQKTALEPKSLTLINKFLNGTCLSQEELSYLQIQLKLIENRFAHVNSKLAIC
jgi:hypothetical protein